MKSLEIGMFTGKSPSRLNIDWTDLNDLQTKALHAGCSDTSQDEMVVSSTLKITARCSTCLHCRPIHWPLFVLYCIVQKEAQCIGLPTLQMVII